MHRDGPRPAVIGICSHGLPQEDGASKEQLAEAQLSGHLEMIEEEVRQQEGREMVQCEGHLDAIGAFLAAPVKGTRVVD